MSEPLPERRKQHRGPINGKIGYALSMLEQMKTLIFFAMVGGLALGFKWSTPGQELSAIRQELSAIRAEMQAASARQYNTEQLVKSVTRLLCDQTTDRDARLAQLECGQVQ